jgi:HlyD family secretion protein
VAAARTWRVARIALLVVAALASIYWFRFRPISVLTHEVQRGPIVAEVMGTGTLEARVKASISPKISGRIARVLVDQGDRVATGQLLAMLDDAELRQQVEIAAAGVAVAEAALDRLKADKDRAVAVGQQADFDYERTRDLYEKKTAASVEIEKATEALSIARAELARAGAAIVEGQRELIAAQKTLAYHQARLADTAIAAPFDGLIVRRHRDPGDVVAPGGPVLTLVSTDELWISAWVDETAIARLAPAQAARVVFRSEPGRVYPGQVSRLSREADRETREFVVDVRVMALPETWAVGQRAEVFIETVHKEDVVVLPATYLVQRDKTLGVYLEAQGRAAWRDIEVGLRSRDSVEVVDGLQPGDLVLVPSNPENELADGRRVGPAR